MISVCNLEKRYGDFCAVTDVSFEVQKGEIVGLLGQNGAGKTTIMKMITGYLQPTKGKVTVGGFDGVADRQKAQQLIGYLPENAPLYPEMLVQEYLWMMAELRGIAPEKIHGAVSRAVLACGLSEKLVQPIGTLSKGYRQRVGLAQAILHHPSVLILDEPTNGLDPTGIHQLRDVLKKYAHEQGGAVMVSSHILSEMQLLCDRVGIINNGKLIKVCTMEELEKMNSSSRYILKVTDAQKTKELLSGNDKVSEIEVKDNIINAGIDEENIASIVRLLVTGGVDISEVKKNESSLEEVFLQVTGGGINIE